jgi:hypothetical protein
MTDTFVFDFVQGTVLIRDRSGQTHELPQVLELVPTAPAVDVPE